jgi:tellurite methyltransferase
VFPEKITKFLGIDVSVPKNADIVLESIYGTDWSISNPAFQWRRPKETAIFFRHIHDYQRDKNKDYWDNHYKTTGLNQDAAYPPPSQYAVFLTDFLDPDDLIVEFGCGSGRDALFFSLYGWNVIASDYSDESINSNLLKFSNQIKSKNLKFIKLNVADTASVASFLKETQSLSKKRRIYYSRFFLHAISEEAEDILRNSLDSQSQGGDLLAIETRISGDELRPKMTPPHYRRNIDENKTIEKWENLGWNRLYVKTGDGLAKYKQDDALVCRFILQKSITTNVS